MAPLTTEMDYALEISAAKQRLAQLKERAAKRARLRGEVAPLPSERDTLAGQQPEGALGERDTDAHAPIEASLTAALQKVIAAFLLDPATIIPIDSQKIHRELMKSELAPRYEEIQSSEGGGSLEAALRELGEGDSACLEVEDFDVNNQQRIMVLDIKSRARLVMIGGVEAPVQVPVSVIPPPPMRPALPPPPASSLPQAAFKLGGQSRPQMGAPGFGGAQHGPTPGPGPPGFARGPAAGYPMSGMGDERFGGPVGGLPPAPRHFGMNLPGPPPLGIPSQHSLIDDILGKKSIKDRQQTEKGEELLELISKPTAKTAATVKKFRTAGGPVIREHCPKLTREDCAMANGPGFVCNRLHFRVIVFQWTDPSLGNCSYLDTCRHMNKCKFIHYELDDSSAKALEGTPGQPDKPTVPAYLQALPEPQWLNCDVRSFDMSVLGKFGVIMTDPPWEIHQDLPYGTMADNEMRKLDIGTLQDDGVIFVWVTGRAMELGRECLEAWGYKRVDELIWVKTNQLQRLIRTGRTGHWLNHSKEHCLVGYKGNPQLNRLVDTDVVVAEVRETSRKPDEMYSLLERLSPGTRKLEIFARQHNVQKGWVSLGNQLKGNRLKEPEMLARYEAKYGALADSVA